MREGEDDTMLGVVRSEPELQATIGELLITRFQSHRLKSKLSDKVAGYVHLGGGYYQKNSKCTSSKHSNFHRKKLYRISFTIEEIRGSGSDSKLLR